MYNDINKWQVEKHTSIFYWKGLSPLRSTWRNHHRVYDRLYNSILISQER